MCLLQLCSAIPKGKVTTYGAMSQALHSSPRAVGQVKLSRREKCAGSNILVWCVAACVPVPSGLHANALKSSFLSQLYYKSVIAETAVCLYPLCIFLMQALRRNPFAPKVPCHRVIAASLELGGFSGQWVGVLHL